MSSCVLDAIVLGVFFVKRTVPIFPYGFEALIADDLCYFGRGAVVAYLELLDGLAVFGVAAGFGSAACAHTRYAEGH